MKENLPCDRLNGNTKTGQISVGVVHQWLGRIGKVDNGQMAVFGVLANGTFVSPVAFRLYLPQKWTEDPTRCEKLEFQNNVTSSRQKTI